MTPQQGPPKDKRTLVVRTCKQVKSGTTNGRDWTIYECGVATVAGEPIDAKFNSFRDLAALINKPVEYEIEVKVHAQYGTSYTLFPPKRDFEAELDQLAARVARLESQAGTADIPAAGGPPMPPGVPAAPSQQPPSASVPSW